MFDRIKAYVVFQIMSQPCRYHVLRAKMKGDYEHHDIPFRTVCLERSNQKLNGYYLDGDSSKPIIILYHGYGSCAKNMLPYADHFWSRGYDVFIPDLRAHGKSQGKYSGLGIKDVEDIDLWMGVIDRDNNRDKIIFGASMGGTIALRCTQLPQERRIKKVILDSTPIDFGKVAERVWKWKMRSPWSQIEPYLNRIMNKRLGFEMNDFDLTPILTQIRMPVLFIHGQQDGLVNVDDTKAGFEKIRAPKQFLLARKSNHMGALYELGNEYWTCVDGFITQC